LSYAETALRRPAYWHFEVIRATEVVGLLEGQKVLLNLETKSTRAATPAPRRLGLKDDIPPPAALVRRARTFLTQLACERDGQRLDAGG
jgi:hypothetical protein